MSEQTSEGDIQKIPEKLYKYVPPERIDILINLKIRLTPVEELNDPNEFRPRFEPITINDIRSFCQHDFRLKNIPFHTALLASVKEEEFTVKKLEELRDKTGILSLTCDDKNPVMWSHYAANHKGFVIQFDSIPYFLIFFDRNY